MISRAADLIAKLNLAPHPEGGCYREVFRSGLEVEPHDGRPARCALTTIYFLLRAGERSRLHRVASDEVWHYYEGSPLELVWLSEDLSALNRMRLGPVGQGMEPVAVAPAGCWQAAVSTGEYTLVGCSVAPGFDFADFTLIDADSDSAAEIAKLHPALDGFR